MQGYRTILNCDRCGSDQVHVVSKRTRLSLCEKCKKIESKDIFTTRKGSNIYVTNDKND